MRNTDAVVLIQIVKDKDKMLNAIVAINPEAVNE
jgi:hypothetical protein